MNLSSIHIYLHDVKQHPLFIQEQLVSRINRYGVKGFFLRSWKNGPHIEWVIEPESTGKEFNSFIDEQIKGLQDAMPKYRASTSLNNEIFKKQYEHLQLFELQKEGMFSIEKDGIVKRSTSVLREDIWGETGASVLKQYYVDTSELVLDMIRVQGKKYENAFMLTYAVIAALGNPKRHQLSYRSHAEAFLGRFDQHRVLRHQLEAHYEKNKQSISEIFNEKIETSDLFRKWKEIFQDLVKKSSDLFRQGKLSVPEAEQFTSIIEGYGWDLEEKESDQEKMSEFHKFLNSVRSYEDVKDQTNYKVKRLLLNFMYLTLVQLGIKATEKFSICYCVSRWFEEQLEKGWKEQLLEIYHTEQSK